MSVEGFIKQAESDPEYAKGYELDGDDLEDFKKNFENTKLVFSEYFKPEDILSLAEHEKRMEELGRRNLRETNTVPTLVALIRAVDELQRARTQRYEMWRPRADHSAFATKFAYYAAGSAYEDHRCYLFFPEDPDYVYHFEQCGGRFARCLGRLQRSADPLGHGAWQDFLDANHLYQYGLRPTGTFGEPTRLPVVWGSGDHRQRLLWPSTAGLPVTASTQS